MHDATDRDLLKQYAKDGSDTAFAALVSRHVNLVYCAALRKTRNPHAAEEITQVVFSILAQKAGRLSQHTILPGWLYETARLTTANFLKSEVRRARREQEAYMQTQLPTAAATDDAWEQLAPFLEDAMGHLSEADRAVVVLRYFGDKSFAEVGTAAGITENAAKKQVNRALEKLHRYFTKRGVTSTTAVIAGAISANSIQAAPIALAKSVTAVALAKGVSTSTLTLIKGTLKLMAWTKAKTAIIAGTSLLLATGTTTVILKQIKPNYLSRQEQIFFAAQACLRFASEHNNQLPDNLGQLTNYYMYPPSSNWELVSGGSLATLVNPSNTIILREKEPQQTPRGLFVKTYAFADGHATSYTSADTNFTTWEKERGFVIRPKTN